ncbi:MAG TPA: energy-coupling factor transporter transmembrane component T [Dermatophilaceae bacterium]|nr:energy-coupling factor transporter transmembrane component T [Dermatophilaceae bacterium]
MTTRHGAHTPRLLHPVAWWTWALCLAVAASRTTNPYLLLLLIAVVGWVVLERREPGQSRVLLAFLAVGAFALALRLAMTTLLGGGVGGTTVVLTLPEVPLPDWAGALRIGGEVSREALLVTAYEAAQLVAILACLGAANALASPRRLLRYLPATLYDVGTALVVGLTYAPQLVIDAAGVRRARTLRGHSGHRPRELGRLIVPVTAGALERSLDLAASMESRGYGRAVHRDPRRQHRATGMTVLGVVGVLAGLYGLLDGATPPVLGVPVLLGGVVLAAGSLWYGSGRDRRSHYRRDPWSGPEWLVVAVGLVTACLFVVGQQRTWEGMSAVSDPSAAPELPLLAVAAIVLAALAGVLTPAQPHRDAS